MKYIIKLNNSPLYVCAPSGYALGPNGIYRDGTNPRKSDPERGPNPFLFTSLRYAQQQAAKCSARVLEWRYE